VPWSRASSRRSPWSVRHAAGKPAGRTLLGRPVHRRPAAGPGLPLLPPAPRGGRERQGAGVQESGRTAENLRPILLRRTRDSVMQQLAVPIHRDRPHRADRRAADHARGYMQTVSAITSKKFLTEMDLLRLQKYLLMCRMCANSTSWSTSSRRATRASCSGWPSCSISCSPKRTASRVVFRVDHDAEPDPAAAGRTRRSSTCGWTAGAAEKRQQLVNHFQRHPRCQLFLTTNAGSTGLNLQAANTVINVDLPWNPAVLEQRIARAHRMGQKRPVQVFVMITEDTLEDGCWPPCRPSTNWRWRRWIPIRTSTRSSWHGHGRAESGVWRSCWAPSPKRRSTNRSRPSSSARRSCWCGATAWRRRAANCWAPRSTSWAN
jgi:hypothetical protein